MERVVMKMAMLVLASSISMVKPSGAAGDENNLRTTTTVDDYYIDEDYYIEANFTDDYSMYDNYTPTVEEREELNKSRLCLLLNHQKCHLNDYFLDKYEGNLEQYVFSGYEFEYMLEPRVLPPNLGENKMVKEIIQYIELLKRQTVLRLIKDLQDVTAESIFEDLNHHCSEELEAPIKDLRDKLTNTTCVVHRLMETLLSSLEKASDVTIEKCSHLCTQENLTICSTEGCGCTLDHGLRFGQLMKKYVRYRIGVNGVYGVIPLDMIVLFLGECFYYIPIHFNSAVYSWIRIAEIMSMAPSIELFGYENQLIQINYEHYFRTEDDTTVSDEELTWGVVGSNTGTFHLPCSNYGEVDSRNSTEFDSCDTFGLMQSVNNLLSCVYKNSTSVPLAWSTVTSVYVDSRCLCLAFRGKDCGVKAPRGVDDRTYCLSVLLRDFQRQVSYRPAATYLDYAFMTPIPVCLFTKLLQVAFDYHCYRIYDYSQPVICYFKDLFNKEINCTQRLILNTSNIASLCDTMVFMRLVLCKDATEYNKPIFYYRLGDSTLVLTLTYVDLGLRVLTLVTYLACSELRNLPGKLFIGYQLTALIRLIAVRAILEDLQLAVRLDVSMDLASTLWLTAYLHFVTMSIRNLRPPNSLSLCEALVVLLRSSLFGCALPAALSAAFFIMDEVLEGHVQVGQLLFVLCNYMALFTNLLMFYLNIKVYYEIRSDALQLQRNLTARQVFADLFNFALKTSVMSGAGILFRLVFTQIPGLVHVISYYHALGTFHGLLLFLLYGCNREARVFWLGVWRAIHSRCHLARNSLELEQRPT